MDVKHIDDHHLIERYLAEDLSASECEAFEAYYREHPEIVREMEAVARFKAGLNDLHRVGELDRLVTHTGRFEIRLQRSQYLQ
jgi:hypothetical protein